MDNKLLDELNKYSSSYSYEEKIKDYIKINGISNIDKYLSILYFKKYNLDFCDFLFSNGYILKKDTVNKENIECDSIKLYIDKYLNDNNKEDFYDFITQYDISTYFFNSYGHNLLCDLISIGYIPSKKGNMTHDHYYYVYYMMLKIDNEESAKEFIDNNYMYSINPIFYRLLYEENLKEYIKSNKDAYSFVTNNDLAYEIYINKTNDISFIDDLHTHQLRDSAIKHIFDLGYIITDNSPYAIRSNPLSYICSLNNGSSLNELRHAKFENKPTDELINIMFEKGYKINSLSYTWILTNELAFLLALKNGQSIDIINYAQFEFEKEFINSTIDNKCSVLDMDISNTRSGLAFKLYYDLNKDKEDFDIQIIDNLSICLNTELVIDIVCEPNSKYIISDDSPYYILCNERVFKAAIDRGQDINIINYAEIYDASSEFLNLIIESNYIIYPNSPNFIFESKETIEKYLDINKEKNIDLSFLNKIRFDVDRKFLRKIFSLGYRINYLTPSEFIEDELLMKEYYGKYIPNDEISNHYLNILNKNYGLINSVIGSFNNLDFINYTPKDKQLEIIRFVYFNNSYNDNYTEKFVNIINKGLYNNFIKIYNKINDRWDIRNFLILVSNYENCINLFNEIIESDYVLSLNEIRLIKICFDKNIIIYSIRAMKDLIDKTFKLNKSNDKNIMLLKDTIFQLICNKTYNEIQSFLKYIFSVEKYNELYYSINNKNLLSKLDNYKDVIKIIEKIFFCDDIKQLKHICNNINKGLNKNNDIIADKMWYIFDNFEYEIKYMYGEEINEKLTNINKLLNSKKSKNFEAKKDYFKVPYSFDLNGRIINKNTSVDYIELKGIPFVFFAHTVNAYGKGGSISCFYNKRIVGKSYICLSAFDDLRARAVVNKDTQNINDVTVLFDNMDSSKLVAFSYEDLNSNGENNSLTIACNNPVFNPIRKTISLTTTFAEGHNEYIYYRDDIKVGGILVYNNPTEYDIMAAAYLNVPIVKVNMQYYPQSMLNKNEELEYEKQMRDYYKYNYNKIDNIEESSYVKKISKDFFNRYFV